MPGRIPILVLSLVVSLGGLSTPVCSQEQGSSEEEPIIRVKTNLVEVRVVVTDKKGSPVRELTRQDFEVLEDGRPQEVSFFSAVEIGSPANDESPSGITSEISRTRSLETPTPADREPPDRTVMLFVDTLHMSPSSLSRVRRSLVDFVNKQMTDHDMGAVVSTKRRLGLTGQFTRNRHVLRYAIEKLSPGQPAVESYFTAYLAAQIERGDREALNLGMQILSTEEGMPSSPTGQAVSTMQSYPPTPESDGDSGELFDALVVTELTRSKAAQVLSEASHYRRATLETLKSAADRLAALPGQRLLVLYSDGFTLLDRFGTLDSSDLRDAINRAVSSGVIIYSIDAKGLQPPPMFSASAAGSYPPQLFSYLTSSEKDAEDSLNALAKDTGGEAFFNTNDLTGALHQALEDNRFYYVLAYYPDEDEDDGYGQFTVRIKEHPEYRIRTQKGYSEHAFSRSDKKQRGEPAKEETFQDAVLAPLPVTVIPVTARAEFFESEADDAQVSLHLHIDGEKLSLRRERRGDELQLLALEMMTYVFNEKGKSVDGKSRLIRFMLPPKGVEQLRAQGLDFSRRLQLEPGLYQIRIGIKDRNTEQMGTAEAWVEVPKLKKRKLELSSIILLDWSELDASVETTEGRGKWTTSEFKEGFRFYHSGDAFSYFLVVYCDDKIDPDSELFIKSEFLLNGEPIAPSEWQPLGERRLGEEENGVVVGGQIDLSQTAPGIYELVVSVRDKKSKKLVERSVSFGISEKQVASSETG